MLVIIVVFVFWGVGGNQGVSRNAVATVNDESISVQDFQEAYNQKLDQFRNQFGGSLPKGFLEAFDVKKQVLNDLIQKALLVSGGKEMGIFVSDQEIQDAIQEMTVFQQNDVFDVDRYHEVLKGSKLTPTKFEEQMRQDLLVTKIAGRLGKFARVTPPELEDRFRFENSEMQIEYVVFKASEFEDEVEVDDEALSEYYGKHQDNYKTAPEVQIEYLAYTFEDEMAAITIPDAEIEEYYNTHLEEFGQLEKRRARHILLKITPDNSEARLEEMKKILERARSGEDFEALAREFSEDGSAARGGDLGFFGRGQMVKPFEDAVFSMQPGDISDIVTSRFGHHIIKLEEIRPAEIKPLEEVKQTIETKLKKQQAGNIAFEKANEAYEKIILAGSLAKYAEKFSVTPEQTPFFTKADPPEALKGNTPVINEAFTLKKGELSSLIDSPSGYYIVYVEDIKEPVVPPLEDVREQVTEDFIRDEAKVLARQAAEDTLETVRGGADFEETVSEEGLTLQESDFFSRAGKKGTLPGPVMEAAFSLNAESPYPDNIIASGDSFYVCRFKARKEVNGTDKKEEEKRFAAKLRMEKEKELIDAWLAHLMKSSKVTVNEKMFN